MQLTLRFDDETEAALRLISEREDLSLNQAAVRLLRIGAGIGGSGPPLIGDALDHFVGSWSAEEGAAFEAAIHGRRT